MRLIVGLGNPGPQYTKTRHNLGFLVIAALVEKQHVLLKNSAVLKASFGRTEIADQETLLLMPATYMNNSGISVKAAMYKYTIKPEDVLVVYDDMALAFGAMRVRPSGSAGGHNGIKSINASLGTQDYARLRLGIGKAPLNIDPADYVLGKFTSQEQKLLDGFINQALECIHCWVEHGVERTMNQYNQRNTKNE